MVSGLVENPAWVNRVLARSYEQMQKLVPQWLPKLEAMHAEPGGVLSAAALEYGCGQYGCVFPTLDPSVVLKVTTDDTEAEFAANLERDLVRPVSAHYYQVIDPDMTVRMKNSDNRVYLLWRESANHVGHIISVVNERHGENRGMVAHQFIDRQHRAAQLAYLAIARNEDPAVIKAHIVAWLLTCEAMARQTLVPELRGLGDGLVEVWGAQNVFFGDIHAGNIGCVTRDGKEQWVITDPGHVAVVDVG